MSLTNSANWMYQSAGDFYGYEIDNSLRFNDDDSAYLNRTNASTGDRKTWTFSCWFKRGNINIDVNFFNPDNGGNESQLKIRSDNKIQLYDSGGLGLNNVTDAVFRDTSAWYHLVVRVDTTQATGSNRVRIYINNELQSVTNGGYGTATPSQNYDTEWNLNCLHTIGKAAYASSGYFDGYMAEINHVDGESLAPTEFGEEKSGIWIPKEYSGSYGTNGFHLEFGGNVNDSSGNGNNWTANSISSYDYVPDSPTNNFMTFNPLLRVSQGGSLPTPQQGNLRSYNSGFDQYKYMWSTFDIKPNTGKWYFECLTETGMGGSNEICGMGLTTVGPDFSPRTGSISGPTYATITWRGNTGVRTLYFNDVSASQTSITVANMAAGDIWQWAIDTDTGELWVGRNNSWYGSGSPNPSTGTDPTYTFGDNVNELCFMVTAQNYSIGSVYYGLNAGQDSSFYGNKTAQNNADANGYGDFYYAPPTDFLALCTANLPAPTFDPAEDSSPQDYFNTVLWTGDGSAVGNSITGVGFQPEFVWIKQRNSTAGNVVHDIVRGTQTGGYIPLATESNDIESSYGPAFLTAYGAITSLDSDGFTVVDGNLSTDNYNGSSDTYVAWNWKAGGTGVSNSDGSITSTVSANQDAGFSIATYTGNATTGATVGHGLGVTPDVVLIKARARSGGADWVMYHKGIPDSEDGWIRLNLTNAWTSTSIIFDNTAPSSSVVTLGSYNYVNDSGTSHVMYSFASKEGYSKFGAYKGNGSTDGAFIYTGFRPAFWLVKANAGSESWKIIDNRRHGGYNLNDAQLTPSSSNAETNDGNGVDLVSNGIKIRSNIGNWNTSGTTYIYMAFAEQPFKYANAV